MKKIIIMILWVCLTATAFAEGAKGASLYTVKSGDSLSAILGASFTHEEIQAISKELKDMEPSFMLKAGMVFEITDDEYVLKLSSDKDAKFYRQDEIPMISILKYEPVMLPTVVRGTINSSLFAAVKEIGEDPELAAELARTYEWEFDFFKDIHPGDTFSVLVEKKFVKDTYVGYGRILAASFTVKGKTHKAFYYHNGESAGYYDAEGRALERGFMRVPLSYTRISSRFTDNRLHPVLGVNRPHYGVDYAAPTGTPIMATASGTVVARTYSKTNGNYVHIRHPNGYESYYLHMNGFNKSISVGSQVTQGQVIGYVGQTGLATGPHLCYRIKHNGSWINPLNFKAESPALTAKHIEEFKETAYAYEQSLMQGIYYAGLHRARLTP